MSWLASLLLFLVSAEGSEPEKPIHTYPDAHGNPLGARPEAPPQSCPQGTVRVEGGTYHRQPIAALCMDAHEVTVAEFGRWLDALATRASAVSEALRSALTSVSREGLQDEAEASAADERCNWRAREQLADHPVNCVSPRAAAAYCEAQGKRLPSDLEWRWVARGGTREYRYPWGNAKPSEQRVNMGERTAPVMRYPASPTGFYDLGGNVREWVACGVDCIARGGSFATRDEPGWRVTYSEGGHRRDARSDQIGFRCVVAAREEGA